LGGRKAVRRIGPDGGAQFIHAANHPHIGELAAAEPRGMANSVYRYGYIGRYIGSIGEVTAQDLRELLLGTYPEGLACHYHDEYFGTTKSVVMDLNDGTLDICWGGLAQNGWRSFNVARRLDNSTQQVLIQNEKSPEGFFEMTDCGPAVT